MLCGIINLYEIHFYRDKNGKEPVKEYIAKLAAKKDKDSRIKLNKIMDYVKTLSGRQQFCHITCIYETDTKNSTERDRTGKTKFS